MLAHPAAQPPPRGRVDLVIQPVPAGTSKPGFRRVVCLWKLTEKAQQVIDYSCLSSGGGSTGAAAGMGRRGRRRQGLGASNGEP